MYRPSPGIGHRLAIPLALLIVGTAGPLQAQTVGDSVRIHSVVPERVLPGQPAHLHLEGIFPRPNRTLLTRLRVLVDTPRYACELGWKEEAVRALVDGAGLPWLVEADLFSGGEMDARRQCGTIDGVWEDKIEVTLRHPALLRPGSVTVEVALSPPGSTHVGGPRSNHRIDLEVGGRLHVVGHLPDTPVAEPGRDLLLALVLEGGPPDEVEVLRDGAWVPVIHRSDPSTSRLTILPEQYAAPGRLILRLRKGTVSVQTGIPVCIRVAPLETRCPPPPSR